MERARLSFLVMFGVAVLASAAVPQDINTVLMRSTFKLAGKGMTGTAFILGKPIPSEPEIASFVMVTAAHVLNQMSGDEATLFLRKKDGDTYKKGGLAIKIREGAKPLWTAHPSADVAVMYVRLPKAADIALVSTDLIATDDTLRQFEIHPGDRLSCLGYPLGAEGEAGFPILRSGYIASYPLLPTKTVKTFLFDFNVFEGNSGGPVYFVESNRTYGGATRIGTIQFVVGLVSQQRLATEEIKSLAETRLQRHQLGLAVVIHGGLIREALDLLPAEPH
jgi:S1-C subfamily serine protease